MSASARASLKQRCWPNLLLVVGCVVVGIVATISMSGHSYTGWLSGAVPTDLGARNGRLKPCPDRPNCVSSQADDAHHVQALAFDGSVESAMVRIKEILLATAGTRIIDEKRDYLRAQSRSRLFGFVDDLEFLADAGERVLHVRSASRLGHSDFGVNRRRIEAIREQFEGRAASM